MSRIAPEVWARLSGSKPAGDTLTARRAAPDVSDRLLAAIDAADRRHLLIPLDADEESLDDAVSRGLAVSTRELELSDRTLSRYLDLTCYDSTGDEVLDLIGGELVIGLATTSMPPAQLLARVLGKWRRFWGQAPLSTLSREAQLGLFAEIWFLLRWLLPNTDPRAATRRWRGPFAARHDFEWPGRSVEVKASTIVRGPVFRVHGIDQLDPPMGGDLLVFGLRLREELGATQSLSGLVAETAAALDADSEARDRYEGGLVQAGYLHAHEAEYSRTSWRIVGEALYPVGPGFPRLSKADLNAGIPLGISEISYTLDLSGYSGMAFADPYLARLAIQ